MLAVKANAAGIECCRSVSDFRFAPLYLAGNMVTSITRYLSAGYSSLIQLHEVNPEPS